MTDEQTPPTPRTRRGARAAAWAVPTALLLAAGGYVGATALAPVPEPTVALAVPASEEFRVDDGSVAAAVDAQQLPSAVGWLDGEEVWANDDAAYPLASITKLVTVLVGQEQEPLGIGEDGPTYTWTDADAAFQDELAKLDGIAYPIPVGTEVTRRQMLTLALVPSANDFATAYAHSIFGDTAGFAEAAEEWATRNGLDSLVVREPSGMDEGNVASAADVVRIARLVLADPALAEFVGTERATLPWGIGEVTTTNPLLGSMPGVIGVKTGRTEVAGFSLAAAARGEFAGRELTRIAVVFGRDSDGARAADARTLLTGLASAPEHLSVTSEGEHLATITAVDGQVVELYTAGTADAVLVPGEEATRTLDVPTSTVAVTGPLGDSEVEVFRDGTIEDPTLWWRITHPGELFGW